MRPNGRQAGPGDPLAELRDASSVLDELARTGRSLILDAARLIEESLGAGGKVIAFGNGGSAAGAEHLVAELIGRFRSTRRGLAAVSLSSNGAVLSALGNDFGQEVVFSRQVDAIADPADVLVAMTTSGRSANVLEAARVGRLRACRLVAFTGRRGGRLADLADVCLQVPSDDVARIQEAHLVLTHAICAVLEARFAEKPDVLLSARTMLQ
jgi:D-sedoheptulose 7-phosphate isomerase